MLTLFTPARAYVAMSAPVTSSGLHSTVISGAADRGTAAMMRAMCAGSMRVGVPPPTNTVSAAGMPSPTARVISVTTAST